MGRNTTGWMGLGFVGLAAILLLFSGPIGTSGMTAKLALALGLLSLTGLGVALGLHDHAGLAFRQILLWSAGAVVFAVLLSFRAELMGAAGGVFFGQSTLARPSSHAEAHPPGIVTLRAEMNGHFFANALVDGTHVTFLVDTGATDVALSPSDAARIGIDLNALTYNIPVNTANGRTFAALADVRDIVIGGIRIERVTVTIPQGELSNSLLGMSFLKRLSSFSIDSDRLVMRQ